VENSPGFQVRDRLFDSPADFVDGGVELLLPIEKLTVWWFSDGRDHAEAEVAFVADPVVGIDPVGLEYRILGLTCGFGGPRV
jgi:hypothetical protein